MNCQSCRTPLKLDPSLQDLNPAAFDLLVGSNYTSQGISASASASHSRKGSSDSALQDGSPPLYRHATPGRRGIGPGKRPGEGSDMSFIMLTESQVQPPPSTESSVDSRKQKPAQLLLPSRNSSQPFRADKIEENARLFEILSARSDIDHPICTECTELLLSSLNARLQATMKERDAFIAFMKETKKNAPTAEQVAEAQAQIVEYKERESTAMAELIVLEKEKADLAEQLAELDDEAREIELEEQEYWKQRNTFSQKMFQAKEDHDAQAAAYEYDAKQLERLQRTNVYNDTFCIGHDGNFGTINGLRLGRLAPPNNVEWNEINAAWGNTCLLLATIAERLGFTFRGYRLRPYGSTSVVEKLDYSHVNSSTSSTTSRANTGNSGASNQPRVIALELFSSGDLPLGRTILHRKFNEAMVAFLECLRQLGHFVENGESGALSPARVTSPSRNPNAARSPTSESGRQGGGVKLPYAIEKDTIGKLSIKLGAGSDDAWTTACKYCLTCCKFLLAHASNVVGRR